MSIRRISVIGAAVIGLAGCNPPHPRPRLDAPLRAIATLDCPQEAHDLTLKSAASDGQNCLYGTDDGAQVMLQLVKLTGGDAQAALAPMEARLKAELPPDSQTTASTATDKDVVDINVPGLHVHAKGSDTKSGGRDNAQVEIGSHGGVGLSINATDGGTRVLIDGRGSGIRRTFILTTDHPGPHGYKMVGYEAEGPVGGPLVVASVMTKDDEGLRDDMQFLLKHNVGG